LFGSKTVIKDPESEFRFYKKREIEKVPQSQWIYEIFKVSMNCKILAQGFILIIFLVASVYYYEIVIEEYEEITAEIKIINNLRQQMITSSDLV
jgi:hypothetical protein